MENELIDVEDLLGRVNIVDYISKIVNLEKRGDEYWCNSPLNLNDSTPSFSINEEKIRYAYMTMSPAQVQRYLHGIII